MPLCAIVIGTGRPRQCGALRGPEHRGGQARRRPRPGRAHSELGEGGGSSAPDGPLPALVCATGGAVSERLPVAAGTTPWFVPPLLRPVGLRRLCLLPPPRRWVWVLVCGNATSLVVGRCFWPLSTSVCPLGSSGHACALLAAPVPSLYRPCTAGPPRAAPPQRGPGGGD